MGTQKQSTTSFGGPSTSITSVPKPPLLSTPTANSKPLAIKWISPAERQERLNKGLCFNCDNRWARGHKCPGKFLLLMTDEEGDPGATTNDGGDDVVESGDISILNSLIGHGSPRSLQLWGTIGGVDTNLVATTSGQPELDQLLGRFDSLFQKENETLEELVNLHHRIKEGSELDGFRQEQGLVIFRDKYYVGKESRLKMLFTKFGGAVPYRPAEDLVYSIVKFIQTSGSFVKLLLRIWRWRNSGVFSILRRAPSQSVKAPFMSECALSFGGNAKGLTEYGKRIGNHLILNGEVDSYHLLGTLHFVVDSKISSLLYVVYELRDLNEQLSATHEKITTKENVVTHHSIIAEDVVSGWEKVEADALIKLTVEGKASNLLGTLKECM
ncbi:hypothetical protein CTI12_AA148910 [Artemisia annua]|uniref:Uncharacterized protein n=1 Tax=Artemisia annua TaxID=35608 RepID=A0A2U1PHJ7_ARTAN|nr:hypothetical protein CTI12_AA148910 [Artemisia annua]